MTVEITKQIQEMGDTIANLKSAMAEQEKAYDAARVEMEEKLAARADELHEMAQKNAQFEATLAKISVVEPESKEDEKRAEIQKEAVAILYSKGLGGWNEAKAEIAELEKKASMYNTLSGPEGGYITLPATMGAMINGRVFESSPIRALADVISIGSKSFEAPHDDDELNATWDSEKATPANTDTTEFNKIEIVAHGMNARVLVTQETLDDAAIDLVSYINAKAADQFARTEATAFVSGNGVGRPRGFLKYTAGTSTYAFGSIEQVVSGSSSALTADGLIDLQVSLKEAYQGNAVFMTKRASFGAIRKLKDGQDQYLIGMGAMGLNGSVGAGMTLLNKPLYFADDMEAVASNALAVAYGDFRAGYQIVDRTGIRVLANAYAVQNQVRYEFNRRVGGGVKNFEAIKIQKVSA